MTDRLKNLVTDMDRSVMCLASQLPEPVYDDVAKKWGDLLQYLQSSPDTRECPMVSGEVCKMS